MEKDIKKQLLVEIPVSTIIILLLAVIITLYDSCNPELISIYRSDNLSLILRMIIQTTGLFLGFIMTAIVLKFNQIDGILQRIGEDLNSFLYNNYFRNQFLTQKELTETFIKYLETHPTDEKEKWKILRNYKRLYDYRNYHKQWVLYPVYYTLITMLVTFLLLFFQKTLFTIQPLFVFIFSLCCLMSIWVVYINISFVLEFFENSFKTVESGAKKQ